jgi:hypothetical protein
MRMNPVGTQIQVRERETRGGGRGSISMDPRTCPSECLDFGFWGVCRNIFSHNYQPLDYSIEDI